MHIAHGEYRPLGRMHAAVILDLKTMNHHI